MTAESGFSCVAMRPEAGSGANSFMYGVQSCVTRQITKPKPENKSSKQPLPSFANTVSTVSEWRS